MSCCFAIFVRFWNVLWLNQNNYFVKHNKYISYFISKYDYLEIPIFLFYLRFTSLYYIFINCCYYYKRPLSWKLQIHSSQKNKNKKKALWGPDWMLSFNSNVSFLQLWTLQLSLYYLVNICLSSHTIKCFSKGFSNNFNFTK